MSYRIVIDHSLCSGFGSCADADPESFEVGPDGRVVALVETTDREQALDAALTCPMAAITVLDESGVVLT
jgi:ferredoxin